MIFNDLKAQMMTAKEFYNKKALKHQLKRAVKHDKQYFEDCIIEIMEQYAQEQVKTLTIPVVIESVCDYCEKPIDTEKDSIVCGACREKIGF